MFKTRGFEHKIEIYSRMMEHWRKVKECDGKKPPLISKIGAYIRELRDWNGFVVDGRVDEELKEIIKSPLYFLKVKKECFIPDKQAKKRIQQAKEELKSDSIMLVAVPDARQTEGWTIGFVLRSDFFVEGVCDPEILLEEGAEAQAQAREFRAQGEESLAQAKDSLAQAKELAYLAITGLRTVE